MKAELRSTLRRLRQSPAFTVVAVLTLALGIGLSTAAFCTIDTLVLRRLPYPESEDLAWVFRTAKEFTAFYHSPGAFLELRRSAQSFADVSSCSWTNLDLVHGGAPATRIETQSVSPCFFNMLRVRPLLGRDFVADDEFTAAAPVAIITHAMWTKRFGNDPDIVGKAIRLSRQSYVIVGVLPASFEVTEFWGNTEVFFPFLVHPSFEALHDTRWLQLLVRRKPGVSVEQAQAELAMIAARLARDHPRECAGDGFELRGLRTAFWRTEGKVVTGLMLGLSALLLLAACINLAGLQLVRGVARERELAIRCALGAGRWQVMAPALGESLLLAAAGGVLGLLVAKVANMIIGRFIMFDATLVVNIPLDARAFAVATGTALIVGLVCGLAPALEATHAPPGDALKEGGRAETETRAVGAMRRVLIIGEIAIALVLVCTASTFAAACLAFTHRPLGWKADGLFHGIIILPWDSYSKEPEKGRQFVEDLERDLVALPGVRQAALSSLSPLWGSWGQRKFVIEGTAPPDHGREPLAAGGSVTLDYFATMEIPLIRGRLFQPTDRFDSPRVAVVNRAMADALWPGGDAIGQRIRYLLGTEPLEIVGIVGDIEFGGEAGRSETRFQIYQPATQTDAMWESVLLRTEDNPASYTETVRRVIAARDPDLTLNWTGTAASQMRNSNRYFDMVAGNLVVFAIVALFIAVLGIYGVIANLTAMSVRAIAVRVALGARYADIMHLILGHGMRLVFIGLIAGAALTFVLVRTLGHYVSGLHQPGAWIIVTAMAALAAAGLLACWLPAHRAARVDPLVALRGT